MRIELQNSPLCWDVKTIIRAGLLIILLWSINYTAVPKAIRLDSNTEYFKSTESVPRASMIVKEVKYPAVQWQNQGAHYYITIW